jgi:hypothetical protein
MPELQDVRTVLQAAERAAAEGDLASTDELLRNAARIQETELGPLHPDLADTLNNLAIVAEKAGRPGDAETFYRRAVAIAAASLPPGDPRVAASRQNLDDFCRARGLPIDAPVVVEPVAQQTETGPPPIASHRLPPAARLAAPSLATVGIGLVVLASVALLVMLWSSGESSAPALTSERAAPQAADPAQTQSARPVEPAPSPPAISIEPAQPVQTVPRDDDRDIAPSVPVRRPSDAVTLATVHLCRTFSTSGGNWRCDPAGDSAAPGPIVLYTRVTSSRDAVVVHRWYRGDVLRQSVRLPIRANLAEGYRTYSRQSVTSGEEWRVEVRSEGGNLLHEQRLAVR